MTDRKLAELLASATPFALPLAKPFRGVTHREGVLLQGPSGFGEFAPFLEYDDNTCACWLASGIEAAYGTWPQAVRDRIPVNAIIRHSLRPRPLRWPTGHTSVTDAQRSR